MSVEKKKTQVLKTETQSQEKELSGSGEYLASHKFDRIDRTMQANILEHNQSKKLEILRAAKEYENAGYPITKICDRITKKLQGPKYETSGSYVRKVLPPKYKDPEQMATAFQQNNAGDTNYRQQEQVLKKPVEQITLEDLKLADFPKSKLRQLAKHVMQKILWLEQQAKQNQNKDIDIDKDKDQIAPQEQKQVLDQFEDEDETVNVSDLVFPATWIKRKGDNFELFFAVDLPGILKDIATLVKRNKTEDDYVCLGLRAKITFDSKTGEIQQDEFEVINADDPWGDDAQDYDIPKKLWMIKRREKRKEEKINKEKAKPKPKPNNTNTDT